MLQVRVQVYDDGQEVADYEFDGDLSNMTGFFNPSRLRKSSYDDIPIGPGAPPFAGDDFSFDGSVELNIRCMNKISIIDFL